MISPGPTPHPTQPRQAGRARGRAGGRASKQALTDGEVDLHDLVRASSLHQVDRALKLLPVGRRHLIRVAAAQYTHTRMAGARGGGGYCAWAIRLPHTVFPERGNSHQASGLSSTAAEQQYTPSADLP